MNATDKLAAALGKYQGSIGRVVDFNSATDKLLPLDLTAANSELTAELLADTKAFGRWIDQKLAAAEARYAIGGYMEHRTIYSRSAHFNTADEPRRLHLGIDIWGNAGTPVYAPIDGVVHSFADNNNFGDYGPTIILQHNVNGLTLFSLYGHLSRKSLEGPYEGKAVKADEQIATLGADDENGQWPPHLHFQLMLDNGGMRGDYPGVGKYSQKEMYVQNIPDPRLLLRFIK
ncbi:peptidase M23 [Mucilaginibacter terrenus]|uniref:Peptidase M23 n=1 Tax=Mucilaginibacter terrenus TaxID=2482727 RepID=A0A3E2NPI4_9SPHI|nr:peptidoglycan DD-metalloendopeptidase family protein [Mucilaginibacter terrenus]RFZ82800.1 peptidase M23 [Mucilaginibacter terrenus]